MKGREYDCLGEDILISEDPALGDDYKISEVDSRVYFLKKFAEEMEEERQLEKERVREEIEVVQGEKPVRTEKMCDWESDRFIGEDVALYRGDEEEFASVFASNPSSKKRSIVSGGRRLFNSLFGRGK